MCCVVKLAVQVQGELACDADDKDWLATLITRPCHRLIEQRGIALTRRKPTNLSLHVMSARGVLGKEGYATA